jgi:hypothetical protein
MYNSLQIDSLTQSTMSNKEVPITIDPWEFADPDFHRNNAPFIDAYVKMRARNVPARQALTRVFGAQHGDSLVHARIINLEGTDAYCSALERAIHGPNGFTGEWTAKQAVWQLRELANDPNASVAARNGAIRELNLLTKITVMEDGQTKVNEAPDFLNMLAQLYPGFDLVSAKEAFEADLILLAQHPKES